MREKSQKVKLLESITKAALHEIEKKSLEHHQFDHSVLYCIDNETRKLLISFDAQLSEYKKDTRRGKIYSIDSFLNLLNPDKDAFEFTVTKAYKSSTTFDKGKIKEKLESHKNESIQKLKDSLESLKNRKNVTELEISTHEKHIEKEIAAINDYYPVLLSKWDSLDIVMSDKLHRANDEYEQIAFYYYDKNKKKCNVQAHLSTKKPNVLMLDRSLKIDDKIASEKLTKFLKTSINVFGHIYVKGLDDEQ